MGDGGDVDGDSKASFRFCFTMCVCRVGFSACMGIVGI